MADGLFHPTAAASSRREHWAALLLYRCGHFHRQKQSGMAVLVARAGFAGGREGLWSLRSSQPACSHLPPRRLAGRLEDGVDHLWVVGG